jgi:septum formation protein
MPLPLILASSSPRRRDLLTGAGIVFNVAAADINESWQEGETPMAHCLRLARSKALVVADKNPGALVLGADTIVVLDGEILGKPKDSAHARWMLERLSGRTHQVLTAVALATEGKLCESFVSVSAVVFHLLSPAQIEWYLASDEPWDKAGAYAAQGKGAALIEKIAGDFYTVVGLPLSATLRALERAGLPVFTA